VEGDGVTGLVVVLGQQLVDDGSRITIPAMEGENPSKGPKAAGK
jgi:hypothetical protein